MGIRVARECVCSNVAAGIETYAEISGPLEDQCPSWPPNRRTYPHRQV